MSISDSKKKEEVSSILKYLRRLRIHFPDYGDGFFYLLLRELNFDCCEAIDRIANNDIPNKLINTCRQISLEEAKKLLMESKTKQKKKTIASCDIKPDGFKTQFNKDSHLLKTDSTMKTHQQKEEVDKSDHLKSSSKFNNQLMKTKNDEYQQYSPTNNHTHKPAYKATSNNITKPLRHYSSNFSNKTTHLVEETNNHKKTDVMMTSIKDSSSDIKKTDYVPIRNNSPSIPLIFSENLKNSDVNKVNFHEEHNNDTNKRIYNSQHNSSNIPIVDEKRSPVSKDIDSHKHNFDNSIDYTRFTKSNTISNNQSEESLFPSSSRSSSSSSVSKLQPLPLISDKSTYELSSKNSKLLCYTDSSGYSEEKSQASIGSRNCSKKDIQDTQNAKHRTHSSITNSKKINPIDNRTKLSNKVDIRTDDFIIYDQSAKLPSDDSSTLWTPSSHTSSKNGLDTNAYIDTVQSDVSQSCRNQFDTSQSDSFKSCSSNYISDDLNKSEMTQLCNSKSLSIQKKNIRQVSNEYSCLSENNINETPILNFNLPESSSKETYLTDNVNSKNGKYHGKPLMIPELKKKTVKVISLEEAFLTNYPRSTCSSSNKISVVPPPLLFGKNQEKEKIKSIDLLKILEPRKIQSQCVKSLEDTLKKINVDESSPYINPLDAYLTIELSEFKKMYNKKIYVDYGWLEPSTDFDQLTEEAYFQTFGYQWSVSKQKYFRGCLKSLFFLPRHVFWLDKYIYESLFDYQKLAVSWMYELYKNRSGGILADEMGLGKTVQTCSFLRGLFDSDLAKHVLIVLPLTLMNQWKKHLTKWCPECNVCVYHKSEKEKEDALYSCFGSVQPSVLLTTYETLRSSCKHIANVKYIRKVTTQTNWIKDTLHYIKKKKKDIDYIQTLNETEKLWYNRMEEELKKYETDEHKPWDVLILDEAHKIKNPNNQCTQAVHLVNSYCRILLSGTPVANSPDELWSLMDCAQPGLLGNHRTFKKKFTEPIKAGYSRGCSDFYVEKKTKLILELQQIVAPFLLRRLVKDTFNQKNSENSSVVSNSISLSLPDKLDIIVWLSMTKEQTEIYREFLSSQSVKSLFRNLGYYQKGFNSMRAVGILLKLCRHPILLLPKTLQTSLLNVHDPDKHSKLDIVNISTFFEKKVNSTDDNETENLSDYTQKWFNMVLNLDFSTTFNLRELSTKLIFLYYVLPTLKSNNHRCLIFSQSIKMLDLIILTVMEPLNLKYLRIDGNAPNDIRQQRIQEFECNKEVFGILMTTKVGSQGLNLTSADRAIIVDPDWTPANDNQAVARIFRLGQTKNVVVYRLFIAGAIEDHAFRLQTFKQGLSKVTLEQPNQKRYFSEADMKQIFTLRTGSIETLKILNSIDATSENKEKSLLDAIQKDIGPNAYDKLWDSTVLGISDYNELHKELNESVTLPHDISESLKTITLSSVNALKKEQYDETQLVNLDFIRDTIK